MTDLITLCWEQFVIIYALGKTFGIAGLKYLLVTIFIFGLLRSIYKYAAGDSFGKPTHSAWILRFIDWIAVKGWDNTSEFLKEKKRGEYDQPDEQIPVGFNLLGILIDIGIIGAVFGLSLLIWPGILLVTITFGPLQWCRNRNMRKKEFIAKLKGTETR